MAATNQMLRMFSPDSNTGYAGTGIGQAQRDLQKSSQQYANGNSIAGLLAPDSGFGSAALGGYGNAQPQYSTSYPSTTSSAIPGGGTGGGARVGPTSTGGGGGGSDGGVVSPTIDFGSYRGGPTLHDRGMNMGYGIQNSMLADAYGTPGGMVRDIYGRPHFVPGTPSAAQGMVNQLNSAFADQTARNQNASLYNNKLNLQSQIVNAIAGMGGGGGGGGSGYGGFRQYGPDGQATGMFAIPGGDTGTNVTAQALPQSAIAGAASAMRGVTPSATSGSIEGIGAGSPALADAIQSSEGAMGAGNALAFDRSMTPANANLAYDIQGERANQGVSLANLLLGGQQLGTNDQLFRQQLLQQALQQVG